MAPKRPATSPASRANTAKKRKPAKRARPANIWTGRDDWDELVETSMLSTASVSSRPERPSGLRTLAEYASERAARSFKFLWEDGGEASVDLLEPPRKMGVYWMAMWTHLPAHLQETLRKRVYHYWGGYLTESMISTFHVPPRIDLGVARLPALAKKTKLKPVWPRDPKEFTELIIKGGTRIEDVAIAGLVCHMPNIKVVNLKGCSLAGKRTVKEILKRDGVTSLNLKGTSVTESEVKALLDRFGQQLQVFKVDKVAIENVTSTFASLPFPKLEKLCIPGDILNAPSQDYFRRSQYWQHAPKPRETPKDSVFDWPTLSTAFPSLTHLYLPSLLIPETVFGIKPHTLVKAVFSPRVPIPRSTWDNLLETQYESLKFLSVELFDSHDTSRLRVPLVSDMSMEGHLGKCKLQVFKMDWRNNHVETTRFLTYALRHWAPTLKKLYLSIEDPLPSYLALTPHPPLQIHPPPVLESLELPGTQDAEAWLPPLPHLRYLDLSNSTTVDERAIFNILDNSPFLSRIDLTSCRGVRVRNRRNIFKAWEEYRKEKQKAE